MQPTDSNRKPSAGTAAFTGLSSFSVRARVLGSVMIGLVLMTFVGLLAISRLGAIDTTVNNLADNFAKDQHLADGMVSKILLTRFYANRYLWRPSPATLERYRKEYSEFEDLLSVATQKITSPNRVQMLAQIKSGLLEYGRQFDQIVSIILERQEEVENSLNVLGPRAEQGLSDLKEIMARRGDLPATDVVAEARRSVLSARLNVFKFLEVGNPHWAKAAERDYAAALTGLRTLMELPGNAGLRAQVTGIEVLITEHRDTFGDLRVGYKTQNAIFAEYLNVIGPTIRITASKMSDSVGKDFEEANRATDLLTSDTNRLLLLTIVFGAAIGLVLGFLVSRSITRPLGLLTKVADHLAAGRMAELDDRQIHAELASIAQGRDELAKIGEAYSSLIVYFRALVGDIVHVAGGLAQGNLSVEPTADYRGGFQNIKTSLSTALRDLREVIADIVRVANDIAEGKMEVATQASYRGDFEKVNSALVSASANLSAATQSNRRQDWLKTGLAILNEKMRGEQDLNSLAKNAIDTICNHIKAKAGLIYLTETDEEGASHLKVAADFGVAPGSGTEDALSQSRIAFGTGLVGQAALERKVISRLLEADEWHMIKQSGFAQTVIKGVAIAPFIYENDVRGAVEFTSTEAFDGLQIEFLEAAMPILAVAVNTAESRARMQEVLGRSELQAKELQGNQLELHRSNHELQAQTDLLTQRQQEVRQQNEALEHTQKDLEAKARELEQSNKYKSEFLANMSHELRSPLNSLLILSNLLQSNDSGHLSDQEVSFAKTINTSGNDLLRLIDDILDLSKVEAGKLDVTIEPFRLHDLTDHLDNRYRPFLEDKEDLELIFEIASDVPEVIESDKVRIKQIVANLLSNAVKFCTQGEIKVAVTAMAAADGAKGIEFKVSDTGIGIKKEDQAGIFEVFQQVDGTINRGYGGTGLGLSISRNLAQLLGGTLTVESEQGSGTTFSLRLPGCIGAAAALNGSGLVAATPDGSKPRPPTAAVAAEAAHAMGAAADGIPAAPRPMAILLVAEAASERAELLAALAGLGQTDVDIADDFGSASRRLTERTYDTVVGVQGDDGTEAGDLLVRLVSDLDLDLPPLVVLGGAAPSAEAAKTGTGSDSPQILQIANEAELAAAIASLANATPRPRPVPAPRASVTAGAGATSVPFPVANPAAKATQTDGDLAGLAGHRILLADDDLPTIFALSALLESHGLETQIARNGQEALDLLAKDSGFDLMILDVMMPVMDGLTCAQEIRRQDRFAAVPIIALTAKVEGDGREKSLAAGADDFLFKPVDNAGLLALVQRLLPQAGASAPCGQGDIADAAQ